MNFKFAKQRFDTYKVEFGLNDINVNWQFHESKTTSIKIALVKKERSLAHLLYFLFSRNGFEFGSSYIIQLWSSILVSLYSDEINFVLEDQGNWIGKYYRVTGSVSFFKNFFLRVVISSFCESMFMCTDTNQVISFVLLANVVTKFS